MPLPRVLETEVMDTADDARDYDTMDHSTVNRQFVTDLLAALEAGGPVAAPRVGKANAGAAGWGLVDDEPPPLEALDLGTGTALIPIELCQRHPTCRVWAVDLAVHMLDLARYNVEIAGLSQRVRLAQIDAKATELEDNRFAVVMSNSIVHHAPEPAVVVAEAVRVTAPGGLLFFRDLLRPDTDGQVEELVRTHVGRESPTQQQLFRQSLRAALTLEETRWLAAALGFAPDTVQATSDRHWTWSARKPPA